MQAQNEAVRGTQEARGVSPSHLILEEVFFVPYFITILFTILTDLRLPKW